MFIIGVVCARAINHCALINVYTAGNSKCVRCIHYTPERSAKELFNDLMFCQVRFCAKNNIGNDKFENSCKKYVRQNIADNLSLVLTDLHCIYHDDLHQKSETSGDPYNLPFSYRQNVAACKNITSFVSAMIYL